MSKKKIFGTYITQTHPNPSKEGNHIYSEKILFGDSLCRNLDRQGSVAIYSCLIRRPAINSRFRNNRFLKFTLQGISILKTSKLLKGNFKNLSVLLFLLFFAANLSAHESRPLFIQIAENTTGIFTLKVNTPNSVAENNLPNIIFPTDFIERDSLTTLRKTSAGFLQTLQFEATKASIKGQNFQIQFPKFNPSITSIIQIDLQNEDTQTLVIGPDKNQFLIPQSPSRWTVIRQYAELGVEHIWAGIDHLLFLVCLFIITGFSRKLFWTITGFTLAHSITLIASTLGWIQLSIKPVEACIALSIIFLCNEIAHHHSTKTSLTYRYPVLVSSSFGLLHGFGFASVLGEIGLPKSHLMEALLFFNIGVEIGQLLFLITLFVSQYLLVEFFLSRFKNWSKPALTFAVYGVGILASYWFFERLF